MSEKHFYVEIVTPRRVAFKGEVTSISVPGAAGGFQVLYNHAPLLASLGIGPVKLSEPDGVERHFAISGGFFEVRENRAVLLADTAERSDEIDHERATSSRERAAKRMAEKEPEVDLGRAKLSFSRAVNRLKIVSVD